MVEGGGGNTHFFHQAIKDRNSYNRIDYIVDDQGVETYQPEDIK